MAKYLFILNQAPYGNELSYNGLRLAISTAKREGTEVHVFLMGDASACAKSGQKVPEGYYNIGDMLKMLGSRKVDIGVCGTCMDARGITDPELAESAKRGTMAQLTDWTEWADKVLVF